MSRKKKAPPRPTPEQKHAQDLERDLKKLEIPDKRCRCRPHIGPVCLLDGGCLQFLVEGVCPHGLVSLPCKHLLRRYHTLTVEEWAERLLARWPEQYKILPPSLHPTKIEPGTIDKVELMRQRVEEGHAPCEPGDASLKPSQETNHEQSAGDQSDTA